jgi:hypothetical protein
MAAMTASSPPTDPIADLWRQARAWLVDSLREFRGPAEIAKAFARTVQAAIRHRLQVLEALLMKLMLIEAARLCGESCAAGGGGRQRSGRTRRERGEPDRASALRCEAPADPQTWRVRFHLRIPPPRRARPNAGVGPGRLWPKPGAEAATARVETKARALARRFEALRRVFADPRRVIMRLARKLAVLGRAAAHRIAIAVAPRSKRLGPAFAAAIVHANDASFSFRDDTS